jgi:alpha-D-ribose 1-methylphosphonate 5-triphosphate diphosphatase
LVELHTDNLERNLAPRPGVDWPPLAALLAHDLQLAGAGITTVLDAITVGYLDEEEVRARYLALSVETVSQAVAQGLLKAEHWLHLRCEVASSTLQQALAAYREHPRLRLLSVMDFTPGQRQWINLDKARIYCKGRHHWSDEPFEYMLTHWRALHDAHAAANRRVVVEFSHERRLPLASHDDATEADVNEAVSDGITVSEFPTTLTAARAARVHGMRVIAGGPNLVRGGSHSGNVSALELAEARLLDVISSDYVPASLLMSAFALHHSAGWTLPEAVASVSAALAAAVGLDDRGAVRLGLRADLIRVCDCASMPHVVATYREGRRICWAPSPSVPAPVAGPFFARPIPEPGFAQCGVQPQQRLMPRQRRGVACRAAFGGGPLPVGAGRTQRRQQPRLGQAPVEHPQAPPAPIQPPPRQAHLATIHGQRLLPALLQVARHARLEHPRPHAPQARHQIGVARRLGSARATLACSPRIPCNPASGWIWGSASWDSAGPRGFA